ncbi:Na(+)/H(+) antiporter subunit C [Gulosibacter molinativorax]|uniref:Na(+)/H(+) antiporter subunit C n=1 Tax=Gulosibacter molinativorax TaxID=256821 RepID=A0ABT7C9P8_9MICO|nr:Na(+)/H(+) antiporter subunit C [Gulosibacter molinativorax]MDJ1371933.1 Na(+)/H(+) antiporter subunit C [Gulosibacter molinativorax]QUY62582.1 Putative Na+/H+ antiporter subunit [Gulosibacter molinativorax]
MTVNIVLLLAMIVLYACGIYLLLERSFTRMILGVLLAGNATNLLIFITSGDFGEAPVVGDDGVIKDTYSDPLPQAFILTAIVISFATLAFMLALLYRSWRLVRVDTVADDEDSVSLRHIDPEADDEVFEEGEGPDTEFGELAEAAVQGALTEDELDDEFAFSQDEDDALDKRKGQTE